MSLQYPNRADWLKVRNAQNVMPPVRYAHVSAKLVQVKDADAPSGFSTIVAKGTTLNLGSNERKRRSAPFRTKAARKISREEDRARDLDRREDAALYANEDFDAEKIEQEADAA